MGRFEWIWQGVVMDWILRLLALVASIVFARYIQKGGGQVTRPLLYGLGVFAVLMALQLVWKAQNSLRPRPRINVANLESTLRDWSDAAGYSFKRISDDTAVFHFSITASNNIPLDVVRLKIRERYIVIQSTLTLGAEQRTAYNAMSVLEKNKLVLDLRMELLRQKVAYLNLDAKLDHFGFQKKIPITEDLTEQQFSDSIEEVTSIAILIRQFVSLRLSDDPLKLGSSSTPLIADKASPSPPASAK
jgi:hypothetical protein